MLKVKGKIRKFELQMDIDALAMFLCENDRFGIIIISKRIVYMWFTAKVIKRKKRTRDGLFANSCF